MKRFALGFAAAAVVGFFSHGALAQTATATANAAPAAAAANDGENDHDRFIGRFAVGYFGVSQIPIAGATSTGGAPAYKDDAVSAPIIGGRYWLNRDMGVDLGVGFGMYSGATEVVAGGNTTTTDLPSKTAFAVHGGLPLAFAHGKHYTFEFIPELTVGVASGSIKGSGAANPDISLSGYKIDLGGRIGSEIHFGFMGLPELALEASVGLYFRRESRKASVDVNGTTASESHGATSIATTVGSDPWALFTNNISALYYF